MEHLRTVQASCYLQLPSRQFVKWVVGLVRGSLRRPKADDLAVPVCSLGRNDERCVADSSGSVYRTRWWAKGDSNHPLEWGWRAHLLRLLRSSPCTQLDCPRVQKCFVSIAFQPSRLPHAWRVTNVSLMGKGSTWEALYWQTRVSQQTERPSLADWPNSSGRSLDAIPLAGEIRVSAGAIDKQVRELGCGGSFYAERMVNVPDVLPINGDAAA